jgi:hypothetical protein
VCAPRPGATRAESTLSARAAVSAVSPLRAARGVDGLGGMIALSADQRWFANGRLERRSPAGSSSCARASSQTRVRETYTGTAGRRQRTRTARVRTIYKECGCSKSAGSAGASELQTAARRAARRSDWAPRAGANRRVPSRGRESATRLSARARDHATTRVVSLQSLINKCRGCHGLSDQWHCHCR